MKKMVVLVMSAALAKIAFCAASTHLSIDNRTGVRVVDANATEQIRISPAWETDEHGATAKLSVNGEPVEESSAAGAYPWAPASGGSYKLEHSVFVNGAQVGETLTATFVVSELKPISANWVAGSIALRATGVAVNEGENVYLSCCDANHSGADGAQWKEVKDFTLSYVADGVIVTDPHFASRLGGIPAVKYRLHIGKSADSIRAPLYCTTRTRYGLFVGYSSYKNVLGFISLNTPAQQFLRDATEFKRLCNAKGGFSSDNTLLLSNAGAKIKDIYDAFADFADRTQPGDEFLFFIATHGSDYSEDSAASLSAYDAGYWVDVLQSNVRMFSQSVAVVGVIMSCSSGALVGGASERPDVNAWLSKCGFDQCLGNVAWIASCASSESSYYAYDSAHTLFGQSFIKDGFESGRADGELYGVELDGRTYGGGDGDGVITLGELGRYAKALSKGISDEQPSSVQLENDGLLDIIAIDEGVTAGRMSRPARPSDVSASQGLFDLKVVIDWNAVDTASSYRIYRSSAYAPGVFKWVGTSLGTSYEDLAPMLLEIYTYKVISVSPVGVSEFSSIATGIRGTDKYLSYIAKLIGGERTSITAADYEAKEKSLAANGCRTVGECYALGVNPEDADDDFKIVDFEMVDGKPVISVNHNVDGAGAPLSSRIKTLGKQDLSDDEWVDVTGKDNSGCRYFKVEVEPR